MAKKKKSKLKKLLKGAALIGAAGLGAAALGRRKQNQTYLAEEGGARSILPKAKRFMNIDGRMAAPIDFNANPREIADMVKSYGFDTSKANMGMPIPSDKTLAGNYRSAFDIGLKKGGRVGCGAAKKGFGRAMKRKKK